VTGSATPGDPEPADSNLVALVVGNIGDYHWYRRDRNGKWTHKPGGGTARDYYRRRLPGGGVERGVVTDPRNKNQIQPYDTFCAYMKVVKPAPTIVGESVDPAHTSIPSSGLRCTRLVYSGIPDPYHDVVGPEADEIIQLIPTLNECLANAVPDPNLGENSLWTAPIGQHATDVEPGAARASEMPPLVRVAAGVVGFYYDDEETDPIFCSDIHDLQSALTPPTPGMSTWGLIALAALLPLGAIVILMSRRTAVA